MVEQKVEKKKEQVESKEVENKGVFSHPEMFGGKLKMFRKGSDPNDPKNYRDLEPEELKIYEEREKEREKEQERLKLEEERKMVELSQAEIDRRDREKQERINKEIEFEKNLGDAVKAIPDIRKDIDTIKVGQATECTTTKCVMDKLEELEKRMDDKKVLCQNCGQKKVEVFDSFCPNCGDPIEEWTDEKTGYPADPHWIPTWKKMIVQQDVERAK